MSKTIITCAITGAIHTPSMSATLPVTADEIVSEAVAAAGAGAAIVHLHARDPETGQPDQSVAGFLPIVKAIKSQVDVVINITTGGAPWMKVEQRIGPAQHFQPELASLNMGSMNMGLYGMLRRYSSFKHAWERQHLEDSADIVFRNSFRDIEFILTTMSQTATRFEFECYDVSHLYNLAHFLDRKLVTPPLFVQTVFGLLGGIGAHPDDIFHMKRTADRLLGSDYQWSVLGAGRNQMPVAAMSISAGGHVRVGLEDSLWAGPGRLASSNAEQVEIAKNLICNMGREVATPAEARNLLALKGSAAVNF